MNRLPVESLARIAGRAFAGPTGSLRWVRQVSRVRRSIKTTSVVSVLAPRGSGKRAACGSGPPVRGFGLRVECFGVRLTNRALKVFHHRGSAKERPSSEGFSKTDRPPRSRAVLLLGGASGRGGSAGQRFQMRGAWPAPGGVRSIASAVRYVGVPGPAIPDASFFSRTRIPPQQDIVACAIFCVVP